MVTPPVVTPRLSTLSPTTAAAPRTVRVPPRPADIAVWHQTLLDTCGHRASNVAAVAALLQDGPATIQSITAAFGRDRKWTMRSVALGRELGLFTRSVGARNLQTFALAVTPSSQRVPMYPVRAILATGSTPMSAAHVTQTPPGTAQRKTPSAAPSSCPKKGQLTPNIRSILGGERVVSSTKYSVRTTQTQSSGSTPISRIPTTAPFQGVTGAEAQSTPGAEPKVTPRVEVQRAAQRPKRKYPKPIPVPYNPAPEMVCTVLNLAETWAAACRVAFERRRWHSSLRSDAWCSADKKQQRRWRAFYRMQHMLQEHQIDPIQYCVAIAWNHANRRTRPIPNPASMSGAAGRDIWWWWHTRLTQYESQKWVGVLDRVRAEAAASIASQEARLRPLLRQAWDECRRYGTHQTVTLLWAPEVVWLLRFNEPAAKRNLDELLARPGSEQAQTMRAALRDIWNNVDRQVWLQKIYVRTFGPRQGQLPEFPISEEQMQALAAQRAQRKRLEQRWAREQEELRAAGFRQAEHTMMAAARHRQQMNWARQGGRS